MHILNYGYSSSFLMRCAFHSYQMMLLLALATLLSIAPEVQSHAVEVRHCITNQDKLRIFVEHWHEDLTSTAKPGWVEVRNDSNQVVSRLYPQGLINNEPDDTQLASKGDCASTTTILDKTVCKPSQSGSFGYDDWVYYDFDASCSTPSMYTFLSAETMYLRGWGGLYPVSISEQLACQIANVAPVAACTEGPVQINSGGNCQPVLAMSIAVQDIDDGSHDTDGTIENSWVSFPNGETSLDIGNTYTVELHVEDDDGATNSCTTTIAINDVDSDDDGVLDCDDICPDTDPSEEAPIKALNPNQFYLDFDTKTFVIGTPGEDPPKRHLRVPQTLSFTNADTNGCSCADIVKYCSYGSGHLKKGCSPGIMKTFVQGTTKKERCEEED